MEVTKGCKTVSLNLCIALLAPPQVRLLKSLRSLLMVTNTNALIKVGKEGVTTVQEGKTLNDEVDITKSAFTM